MMTKQLKSLAIAASASLTLLLAGCGSMGYQQVDPYGSYTDPYGTGGYDSGTGYSGGYDSGSSYSGGYDTGSSYGGSTGYDTGYSTGTTGQNTYVGGELTANILDKKKEGFIFFKKMSATIQIKNPTQGMLTGDVTIHFTKGGKVVDTQTEFVSDLGPGQTHTFDKKARKTSDDVEVTVVTKAPSQLNTGSSYGGYGSGTGYSDPYGTGTSGGYSDPYGTGSSYGGGTGSTYGGSTGSGYGY